MSKKNKSKKRNTIFTKKSFLITIILLTIISFIIRINYIKSTSYCRGCADSYIGYKNYCIWFYTFYIFLLILIIITIIALIKNIKRKYQIGITITGVLLLLQLASIAHTFIKYEVIPAREALNQHVMLKPILYLYPEEEKNITVNFDKEELLTTTYPKFNNEWNVLVKPDGSIYENGKYYYALYWEENRNKNCDFEDGFYVEKDNAINFLEEKLTTLGLNDKERNEFIMYWLPKLEENGKSIVHFDLTDELQKENEMIINPKPDSILRIHINVKKVNKKTNIKEQKLPTFKRHGYTAIEWGGTIY